MPIGFPSVSTLPVPAAYRRDELEQRRQQQSEQTATARQQPQQQGAGEITRIRTRASVAAQRAENQAPSSSSFASEYLDSLSSRARNAVAAYSSNGPSIEERLGVELVGLDVYA